MLNIDSEFPKIMAAMSVTVAMQLVTSIINIASTPEPTTIENFANKCLHITGVGVSVLALMFMLGNSRELSANIMYLDIIQALFISSVVITGLKEFVNTKRSAESLLAAGGAMAFASLALAASYLVPHSKEYKSMCLIAGAARFASILAKPIVKATRSCQTTMYNCMTSTEITEPSAVPNVV